MDFDGFIKWLSESLKDFKQFPTLGGRSHFYAQYNQQERFLTIKIGPRKRTYKLKFNDIRKIFERWNNAPTSELYRSSYYQLPPLKKEYKEGKYSVEYWPEAPDKIATPSIPAIIKYWHENS